MTYRDRRARRAERLRAWADKREERADAAYEASRAATAGIPFGQPILVGHHSERGHRAAIARSDRAMDATVEHSRKADSMASRADTIERQDAHAIYSDDPDARERLTEKIAKLEAERDAMKAANARYRAEHKAELKAMTAFGRSQAVPFPSYAVTNIGANIRRLQGRLETIGRPRPVRTIIARFGGECADCGATLERGDLIRFDRENGARCAPECSTEGS